MRIHLDSANENEINDLLNYDSGSESESVIKGIYAMLSEAKLNKMSLDWDKDRKICYQILVCAIYFYLLYIPIHTYLLSYHLTIHACTKKTITPKDYFKIWYACVKKTITPMNYFKILYV